MHAVEPGKSFDPRAKARNVYVHRVIDVRIYVVVKGIHMYKYTQIHTYIYQQYVHTGVRVKQHVVVKGISKMSINTYTDTYIHTYTHNMYIQVCK